MKIFVRFCLFVLAYCITFAEANAQCAMCRASVASSLSEGSNLAANLNTGILYLAAMPYLVIAAVAWLWYKNSKKNYVTANRPSGASSK